MPVFYTVGGAILYCPTPPYTTVGADSARFFTVGYVILYLPPPPYTTLEADAARFSYGFLRDPLLCYPPYTTVGADAARFIRLAARSSTVLPSPTLLLGQMLLVFLRWRHDPLLCYPPLHYCWGRCCPFFTVDWATIHCATPYTTPRLNAACFGAISVGVLGDSSLCYPPTLHLG